MQSPEWVWLLGLSSISRMFLSWKTLPQEHQKFVAPIFRDVHRKCFSHIQGPTLAEGWVSPTHECSNHPHHIFWDSGCQFFFFRVPHHKFPIDSPWTFNSRDFPLFFLCVVPSFHPNLHIELVYLEAFNLTRGAPSNMIHLYPSISILFWDFP